MSKLCILIALSLASRRMRTEVSSMNFWFLWPIHPHSPPPSAKSASDHINRLPSSCKFVLVSSNLVLLGTFPPVSFGRSWGAYNTHHYLDGLESWRMSRRLSEAGCWPRGQTRILINMFIFKMRQNLEVWRGQNEEICQENNTKRERQDPIIYWV